MLVTLIADTHFCASKKFARVGNGGYNTRFLDQLDVFSLIPNNTDVLIHLGDLFHNKFRLEFDIYDKVYNELNKLNIPHKILVGGNHDFSGYWREPTLYPLTKIMKVVTLEYEYYDIENVRFHCIPYPDIPTHFFKNLDLAVNNISNGINILLSHVGIIEGEVGHSNIHLHADIYLQDLLPHKFDYIFLGHYHKHQKLANNVWYVGSPLQHDFGERNEIKGIMQLSIGTKEIAQPTVIPNKLAPQFIQYEINNERELYKLPLNNKDFYKIVLDGAFDRQVLGELSSKYNILFEGGGIKRTETRIEINEDTDIITEYCKLNEVGKEYAEFGKRFL